MLLCLLTNNVGILWIAMELATLSTVLLVSLYRTPTAIEAAWKYFILCGVGIAQALFGTVLLYFAAERVLGEGATRCSGPTSAASAASWSRRCSRWPSSSSWSATAQRSSRPAAQLAPGRPQRGPTPISAVLSGLLLKRRPLRARALQGARRRRDRTRHAGNIMMGFGILSILVAAFSLLRQKDIKRMFSYSSIEHMGIATFAFGLGGPIATFGALLHMLMHSLAKSSIFFTVGHASQMHGTQEMARIRGLFKGNPLVGWASCSASWRLSACRRSGSSRASS